MKREYIKDIKTISEDSYIRVDIGMWSDDDNDYENGVCYGHVKGFVPDKWDDIDEQYYDVFECYEAIYADGQAVLNCDLGTADSNKFSYMTEKEKQNFLEKISSII